MFRPARNDRAGCFRRWSATHQSAGRPTTAIIGRDCQARRPRARTAASTACRWTRSFRARRSRRPDGVRRLTESIADLVDAPIDLSRKLCMGRGIGNVGEILALFEECDDAGGSDRGRGDRLRGAVDHSGFNFVVPLCRGFEDRLAVLIRERRQCNCKMEERCGGGLRTTFQSVHGGRGRVGLKQNIDAGCEFRGIRQGCDGLCCGIGGARGFLQRCGHFRQHVGELPRGCDECRTRGPVTCLACLPVAEIDRALCGLDVLERPNGRRGAEGCGKAGSRNAFGKARRGATL